MASRHLPEELKAILQSQQHKETAKAVNKEMRLILKDYRRWTKTTSPDQKEYTSTQFYNMIINGFKHRLAAAYRDSIEFKHMNHRSVLLFIQLNNTLRAVPFHQVFVNKELL